MGREFNERFMSLLQETYGCDIKKSEAAMSEIIPLIKMSGILGMKLIKYLKVGNKIV